MDSAGKKSGATGTTGVNGKLFSSAEVLAGYSEGIKGGWRPKPMSSQGRGLKEHPASVIKAKAVHENIKADFDALLKKYGVANVRNFARKLLVQVAMEETVRGR